MNISAIIIDSKKTARIKIENLINDHSSIHIIGNFETGKEALKQINILKPDLIFLETKLDDITGFDIIDQTSLSFKPKFIFVTAHENFARKAFDYLAFDYILKPYKEERFLRCLHKVLDYIRREKLLSVNMQNIITAIDNKKNVGNGKISVKSGNKIFLIDINSIQYIIASGYYIEIFTSDNKKYLLRESLSSIITRLNSSSFIRIHRSTIINSDFIEEIISSNYGEMDVKITGTMTNFRVSKSYKKMFQGTIRI
ncbi:LytR/AlgR family response regulator transcription factor [Tenacibaculum jejuense]|uniref:Two-component system response regulator containing LytTR DNA-binding domain n=1 Tax=Tenacibaculum jejuense TaxID=584609 RepID=A0A238UAJ3_9FLAO|nr:LytTR family DNA-binding domain-containing protein [Tenacibaculum jejuense]SNR15430.1 Two-component system response regulator containing LytTR DNA-binding domain [Tenacibaculum jejuense]